MSIHIAAAKGDIAGTVLLPGDPLRARHIAERFLENPVCYSAVRGMLGYTGTWRGARVSVQGTGIGSPSFTVYATELIREFGARRLVRLGTCGAMQEHIKVRDLILAMSASTDSSMTRPVFGGASFAPAATFSLLSKAYECALARGLTAHVGSVLTTDTFYNEREDAHDVWKRYGVLAAEMETAALYITAARHGVESLSILTVSDRLHTDEALSPHEREQTLDTMAELALETA